MSLRYGPRITNWKHLSNDLRQKQKPKPNDNIWNYCKLVDGSIKVFRFQDWGELSVVSVVSWVPAFWSLPDLTFSFTAFAHTVSLPGMQWNLPQSALGGSGKVWGTISGYVGQTSTRLGLWPPSRGTTHQNCAFSQEKTRICRRKKVSGGFYQIIILLRKFSFWPW